MPTDTTPEDDDQPAEGGTTYVRLAFPVAAFRRIEDAAYWEESTPAKLITRVMEAWIRTRETERQRPFGETKSKRMKGTGPSSPKS